MDTTPPRPRRSAGSTPGSPTNPRDAEGSSSEEPGADQQGAKDWTRPNDPMEVETSEKKHPESIADDEGNDHAEEIPANQYLAAEEEETDQERREILAHRKILLKRVRQSKAMAQKRLDELLAKDPKRKDETEELEIAAFNERARQATSLARKQARSEAEGQGEKRTSVSLRRGSTVGKRMNAALSSLGAGPSIADVALDGAAHAAAQPPSVAMLTAPAMQQTRAPTVSKKDAPKIQLPAAPNRLLGHKTLKAAQLRGPLLTIDTGLSAAGSVPPQHRPPQQPLVVFPEAIALRERKKALDAKLAIVLTDRRRRMEREQRQKGSGGDLMSMRSVSSTQGSSGEIPTTLLQTVLKGPGKPLVLPSKRKSQWDYLLEEMRWLATDYHEERKWKASASRAVGGSVLSRDRTPAANQDSKDSTLDEEMVLANDQGALSEQVGDESSQARGNLRARIYCRVYVNLEPDDIEESRGVARTVATMLLELSAVIDRLGVFPQYGGEFVKALQRYRRTVKGESENIAGHDVGEGRASGSSDMELDKPVAEASEPGRSGNSDTNYAESSRSGDTGEKERAFGRITAFIDGIRAKADKPASRSKIVAKSSPSTLELSLPQAKAVDRIEDVWSRVCAGMFLGGPSASGKTVIASCLFWKHKADGPQLLVCSQPSMVRGYHVWTKWTIAVSETFNAILLPGEVDA